MEDTTFRMPLATFLSGSYDEAKGYPYLRDLMREVPIRLMIFRYIETMVNTEYIKLIAERDQGIIIIPDQAAFGSIVMNEAVQFKFNRPIIYRDLPHITGMGRGNYPTETYPMERISVQIDPSRYHKTLYLYYARWRPLYTGIEATQYSYTPSSFADVGLEHMSIQDPSQ